MYTLLCCCFNLCSSKTMSSMFSYPDNHQYVILDRKELLASGHWFWWKEKHGWYLYREESVLPMMSLLYSPRKKQLKSYPAPIHCLWQCKCIEKDQWDQETLEKWALNNFSDGGRKNIIFLTQTFTFWSTEALPYSYVRQRNVLLHRRPWRSKMSPTLV